ncbi:MAG: helix-turn-helix transcriptional regulator, partial [Planctomycetota bacterium]|nr:helix-turn-helix transcriptional regulator [Planctomycetota bacterium]
MVKKYKDGVKEGKTKITVLLLDVLTTTLDVSSDADLAKRLGVKGPSISQWRNGIAAPQRDKLRAMVRALMSSFLEPLAELEPVEPTRKRKRWKLNGDASLQARLKGKCGFYLYYDSMGRVTYAGQAKKNLFGEMEQRLSQSLRHKTYMGKSAKTKPKLQQR